MTIRRQLMMVVSSMIVFAIIASLGFGSLFMNYGLKGYLQHEYDTRVEQITDNGRILLEGGMTRSEAYAAFSNVIEEPIESLQILTADGRIALVVERGSKRGEMMGRMPMHMAPTIDRIPILDTHGATIGMLVIQRSGTIHSTESVILFRQGLLKGMALAGFITLLIGIGIANTISRRMGQDLKSISEHASRIDAGELSHGMVKSSGLLEIRTLQETLTNLSVKLGIQQTIRKENADRISHEARTPLMILKGHLEGVSDGVFKMDEDRTASCLNALEQLSVLLSDMESIVEAKENPIVAEKEELDISTVLRQTSESLRPAFEDRDISLEVELPEHIYVLANKGLLIQNVYNLLMNSCKYGKAGGVTRLQADHEKIIICDDGPGINTEELEHVFDAYYRGTNARGVEGDGLGLYVVRRNTEVLGWTLSAENCSQGGICFTMIFDKAHKESDTE